MITNDKSNFDDGRIKLKHNKLKKELYKPFVTEALPDLKATLIILSVLIRKKAEIINEKSYFTLLIDTFRFLNNEN